MPSKVIAPLPPVVGAAANANATLDVPIGPRYHVIWLRAQTTNTFDPDTDSISTVLGLIRVKLNGRIQRQATAFQFNALQALNGEAHSAWVEQSGVIIGRVDCDGITRSLNGGTLATTAGVYTLHVPIFFAEPWRKEYAAGDMMAWPTSWNGAGLVATFQLEIACGAKLASLTADAEWDFQKGLADSQGNPILLLSKVNSLDVPVPAGTNAEVNINTLPRFDFYQQISIFASGGTSPTVNSVKVRVNNLNVREVSRAKLAAAHWSRGMNFVGSQDASRLDVVFDYDDVPSSALSMDGVTDFQVIPNYTLSAAGTLSIVYVTYGPLA